MSRESRLDDGRLGGVTYEMPAEWEQEMPIPYVKGADRPPMSPSGELRMDIISRLVEQWSPQSIVEVGAGIGAAAWVLAEGRDYLGYEPDMAASDVAVARLTDRPRARVINQYLPDEIDRTFDLLVAFEVLEHINDDMGALERWVRWVAPGGHILISVPAGQDRFGPYDVAVGHYRRYERNQLMELFDRVGLEDVEVRSYGMPLGYLLETVRNRLLVKRVDEKLDADSRTKRSGRTFQPRSGGALIRALIRPFAIAQRPFESTDWGIGWVASGKRPG